MSAASRSGPQSATVLVAILLLLAGCADKPSAPPLVLFITLDTTRADHLSCYGYFRETSPQIDALARDGILFERAVTPMTTTLPAHVSLLTSTSPLRHRVESNFESSANAFESATVRSIAQSLSGAGWTTAAFVSAASLKRHSGIHVGFEVWHEPEDSNIVATLPANETTDRAIRWLETAPERPIFMWVHYFDPHAPYSPPAEHQLFAHESAQDEFLQARMRVGSIDAEIRETNDRYDGEIHFVDEQIGRLLDKLRESKLYADAAIVLVGDHGEGLGQHDWMTHGRIYNEQVAVPLILKLPRGSHRGRRVEHIVSIVDIIPTLVNAVLLPVDEEFVSDGVDMLSEQPREFALAARTDRTRRKWGPGRRYALITREWKYFHSTEGRDMLFDMRHDFAEHRDVSAQHPQIASKLRRLLMAELESYGRSPVPVAGQAELSLEVEEQLKALGYVK